MTTQGERKTDKGRAAEELLREYFLRAGFYVSRGVKVVFDGIEVTDVDLWLYCRPTAVGRERVNVDIRNKSTPKALERVLWAQGLKTTLGLERCIVATTEIRPTVKAFGMEHDVLVLDGRFLEKLAKGESENKRITEEEFERLILFEDRDKILGDWRNRLSRSKSRLLSQLEFDGCNAWLDDARYFSQQVMTSGRFEAACRSLYLTLSYLLISLDYCLHKLVFEETGVRHGTLLEGFRFGSRGKARITETVDNAVSLVRHYVPNAVSARLRDDILRDLGSIPTDILADFFARSEIATKLFALARTLEAHAYGVKFVGPDSLDDVLQGVLGVLLDFSGLERRKFFETCRDRAAGK